jgi:uncharacterized protein involved in exopolysaccharide biosynthesis
MATISQLRAQRTNVIAAMSEKEQTVKNMDANMRALRGEIDKLRKQERQLTAEITKLARDEL